MALYQALKHYSHSVEVLLGSYNGRFWNYLTITVLVVVSIMATLPVYASQGERISSVFDMPVINKTETGHIQLKWRAEMLHAQEIEPRFELQQSLTRNFANPLKVYEGPDHGSSAMIKSGLSLPWWALKRLFLEAFDDAVLAVGGDHPV